jgi:hypothetical protein
VTATAEAAGEFGCLKSRTICGRASAVDAARKSQQQTQCEKAGNENRTGLWI